MRVVPPCTTNGNVVRILAPAENIVAVVSLGPMTEEDQNLIELVKRGDDAAASKLLDELRELRELREYKTRMELIRWAKEVLDWEMERQEFRNQFMSCKRACWATGSKIA